MTNSFYLGLVCVQFVHNKDKRRKMVNGLNIQRLSSSLFLFPVLFLSLLMVRDSKTDFWHFASISIIHCSVQCSIRLFTGLPKVCKPPLFLINIYDGHSVFHISHVRLECVERVHTWCKIDPFSSQSLLITSTGPYSSCAALLVISNPLKLILVWFGLWVCVWTCEFVCGLDETNKQTNKKFSLVWLVLI